MIEYNKKLYKLRSKIIQNKYQKNINNNYYYDIIDIMNSSIKNLKIINLIYTRADIESLKYGSTSYPDTLLKNDMVNRFNFFASILGYLDAYVEKYNETLEVNYIRQNIIKDFQYYKRISDPKIIVDFLLSCPSYNKFSDFFKDSVNKKDYLILELSLIESYITGYKNINKYTLIEIYYTYIKLISNLENYIITNKDNVDKIRKKVLYNKN